MKGVLAATAHAARGRPGGYGHAHRRTRLCTGGAWLLTSMFNVPLAEVPRCFERGG